MGQPRFLSLPLLLTASVFCFAARAQDTAVAPFGVDVGPVTVALSLAGTGQSLGGLTQLNVGAAGGLTFLGPKADQQILTAISQETGRGWIGTLVTEESPQSVMLGLAGYDSAKLVRSSENGYYALELTYLLHKPVQLLTTQYNDGECTAREIQEKRSAAESYLTWKEYLKVKLGSRKLDINTNSCLLKKQALAPAEKLVVEIEGSGDLLSKPMTKVRNISIRVYFGECNQGAACSYQAQWLGEAASIFEMGEAVQILRSALESGESAVTAANMAKLGGRY